MPLFADWYQVKFDDVAVYRHVSPESQPAWQDSFLFKDIINVCYEASDDLLSSDTMYFFVRDTEASYAIPSEAAGASELWYEIIRRGLFDAELSIRISTGKQSFGCWQPEKPEK